MLFVLFLAVRSGIVLCLIVFVVVTTTILYASRCSNLFQTYRHLTPEATSMLEFMGEGGDVPLLYMYRGMVLNILLLYAWALERKSLFNFCTRLWSNKQRCIRHQHCEVRPPGSEEPSAPSTTMVARSAPVPPPPRRGGAASALHEEAGGFGISCSQ